VLGLQLMQDHFNISDGIDGSAHTYNITYTDAVSQIICVSVDIPVSSCSNGICEHELRMSSSECAASALHIVVAVAGTNVLGTGRPSVPVKVSGTGIIINYCVHAMELV
jgi:hypothetical protein